ncbi:MAG TPA: DUF3306 domain-containing protein [Burkholderiales bacterium]|jgi:hypothetical protein
MTTRNDKEAFLDRWSRRKKEARTEAPPEKAQVKGAEPAVDPKAPPPELPPVDQLTPESDFRPFFHPKIGEDVRRAALKKLFSDPRFNVMDGLDVYIDDYSKTEPIPPEMLAGLRQAQNILQWAKEDAEERRKKELEQAAAAKRLEPPAPQAEPAEPLTAVPDEVPAAPRSRSTDA